MLPSAIEPLYGGVDDKDINYSRLKKFSKCCQDQVSLWVPWNA